MEDLQSMKKFLRLVFDHIINSVNPKTLIRSSLKVNGNKLICGKNEFLLHKNCYVVGFGKAVYSMCEEILLLLNKHVQKGVLSVPESTVDNGGTHLLDKNIKVYRGAKNNLPDNISYNAAIEIINLVKPLTSTDLLIVLISGGGSALFTCPIPSVSLEDKLLLTKLLAKAGGGIKELNCVRKQLSMVKGGKLAALTYPAESLSLVLSDVIGDQLEIIASGPTVPNIHTKEDALNILNKFSLLDKIPKSILEHFKSKNIEKRVPEGVFEKAFVKIIGSNTIALNAASTFLERNGKSNFIISSTVEGRVDDVSNALALFTKYICQLQTNEINYQIFEKSMMKLIPLLSIEEKYLNNLHLFLKKDSTTVEELYFLFGGETTVNVTGKGKGGRNMELALRFSDIINETMEKTEKNFDVTLLCGGTDGIDGPTDAAGAISYISQKSEALNQGMNLQDFIKNNDSYNFYKNFKRGEDIIFTGLTGTNVMDVLILCIKKKK